MQIILKEQSLTEAKETFDTHMQRDFPVNEQKPWDVTLGLYSKGIYEMLEIRSGGAMVGYAWMVCPEGNAALIDYLAVLPQYRGTGIGGRILKELSCRYARRGQTLLLESEFPDEAPDPQIARRRLGFYARAGFLDTGVQVRLFDVRFAILSPADPSAARQQMQTIYKAMFPGELLPRAVTFLN